MRNIRKLYFQNSRGQRWGLNGDRGVYASNLAGFGLTLSPNFADLGRGFFSPVSDEAEPQNPLAFTLTFTRNPYETYDQLVSWLTSAGTITVVYDPTGKKEYCPSSCKNRISSMVSSNPWSHPPQVLHFSQEPPQFPQLLILSSFPHCKKPSHRL